MTCEGFLHQPGGCSPVKLLGFTCLGGTYDFMNVEAMTSNNRVKMTVDLDFVDFGQF